MRILLGGIDEKDAEVIAALPDDAIVMSTVTGEELHESVYSCSPDVLIVSDAMPGIWDALHQINLTLPVPTVMIAENSVVADIPETIFTDLFGYLPRAAVATALMPSLQIACGQFHRLAMAQAEIGELRTAFAARKIIDRAKGLIMQRHRMSEGEAYTHMREESRRRRIPIVEVAKALLEAAVEFSTGSNDLPSPVSSQVRRIASSGGRSLRD